MKRVHTFLRVILLLAPLFLKTVHADLAFALKILFCWCLELYLIFII